MSPEKMWVVHILDSRGNDIGQSCQFGDEYTSSAAAWEDINARGIRLAGGYAVVPAPEVTSAPTAPEKCYLWDLLRATWKGGSTLPKDSTARKLFPLDSGCYAYFPAALVALAGWSKAANEKHNPGQPLQHARGKSGDHRDCKARHNIDSADPSCDKLEELTCAFWRAGAELQEYAETLGAPAAPAATFPEIQK